MRALIPHFINTQFRSGQFSGEFEAISLYVDISGFTALTENLKQHGKDGIEQLSTELNVIFGSLVHTVYSQGGFISTFAGDAFTALFPYTDISKDVPSLAAQAALTIRDFIRDHATLLTAYGTFSIGVKIGLGIGKTEWYIIGEGERYTYLFRGSAIDSCVSAETSIESGKIGIAAELVGLLSETARITHEQNSPELHSITLHPSEPFAELPTLQRADLDPFVLNAVIDFQEQAEFRNVVAVFISLEWLNPKTAQIFIKEVLMHTALYGGYFNKVDYSDKGTVIVVVYGAPTTHANNLARAVNFLLALRRKASSVRWRAGVTDGIAYAGFLGGHERSEYTVIGDEVNVSARQMHSAAWGEIRVSANTADTLRQLGYSLESVGTIQFKGKQSALEIFRLIGSDQRRSETLQIALNFVGRHTELDRLRQWLEPLKNQHFAGVITVSGDAGMGKSYLVFQFMRMMAQYNWCYCPTDEIVQQSLNPFRSFLRRYFDQYDIRTAQDNQFRFDSILNNLISSLPTIHSIELGLELERLRPVLAALVDIHSPGSLYEQLEPKLRFDNMLVAIKTLFLAESLRKPVIIHIEDSHWLDPDSRQLLKTLTRNIAAYPIVILMTSRYQDDGKPYELDLDNGTLQHNLDLEELPPHDIRQLAEQILERAVDESLASVLASKASGNPLFIEQLALDLRERGALILNTNGSWTISEQEVRQVPSSLNSILIARLDRLVAEVRTVVSTATVLGHEFELRILSAMLKHDADLIGKVKQAEKQVIWSPLDEVRYIFRHALLRDAAYDMQLRSRLRELHHMAAEAIEQIYAADLEPHYATLVYHANRAADTKREVLYAKLAGQQTAARFANSEAIKYYNRVLELTPETDTETQFEVLLARERVYDLLGSRAEQIGDLDRLQALAELIDDNEKRAEVLLRRAIHAESTGDYKGTVSAGEIITTVTNTPRLKASGYLYWGLGLVRQADYDAGSKILEKALEVAQGNDLPQIEADAQRSRGVIASNIGDFKAAQMYFELALKNYEVAGNRRSINNIANNLGTVAFSTGDYPRALIYMQQAAKGYLDTGDRFGESIVNNNLGSVVGMLRNYSAALAYTERSLFIAYEIGNRRSVLHSLSNLSAFAVSLGDFERAQSIYDEAIHLAEDLNDREKHIYVIGSRILGVYYQGKWDEAYKHTEIGLKLAREINAPPLIALVLTLKGHVETALQRLDEAKGSYIEALNINLEMGENHLAIEPRSGLARLDLVHGNHDAALQHVEIILEHLKTASLDGTSEPIQLYLICYQVLQAVGDARANEILKIAHGYLYDTASKIPDERRRQMFLENIPHHRQLIQMWQPSHLDNST